MIKIFKDKKGFTIVEALVAITILSLAVIGASAAVQNGINSHILSKDEIVAFYLAQEGVEQIRNMRDENGLNGRNWLSGIASNGSDPCYFNKTCRVDVSANPIVVADCNGTCPVLKQDAASGFYGYSAGWADSPYTRTIQLGQINGNEVSITVTVAWGKGNVSRSFKVRENILNWQ